MILPVAHPAIRPTIIHHSIVILCLLLAAGILRLEGRNVNNARRGRPAHASRKAIMGSTLVARRAGMRLATIATANKSRGTSIVSERRDGNNGQKGLASAVSSKRTITAEARMVRVVNLWNAQPGPLYLKGCQEAGLSNPLP